jgi:hypothetical protein
VKAAPSMAAPIRLAASRLAPEKVCPGQVRQFQADAGQIRVGQAGTGQAGAVQDGLPQVRLISNSASVKIGIDHAGLFSGRPRKSRCRQGLLRCNPLPVKGFSLKPACRATARVRLTRVRSAPARRVWERSARARSAPLRTAPARFNDASVAAFRLQSGQWLAVIRATVSGVRQRPDGIRSARLTVDPRGASRSHGILEFGRV